MAISSSLLQALEDASIGIFHEITAAFCKPMLFFSIHKDSSVLRHFAREAFALELYSFRLTQIDADWKFKEMISFRKDIAKKFGPALLVQTNNQGFAPGINGVTELKFLESATRLIDGEEDSIEKKTEGCF